MKTLLTIFLILLLIFGVVAICYAGEEIYHIDKVDRIGDHYHATLACAVCNNYLRIKDIEARIKEFEDYHVPLNSPIGHQSHWVIIDTFLLKELEEYKTRIEKLEKEKNEEIDTFEHNAPANEWHNIK